MKRGTPRHPKVGHLCELLHIGLALAIGYLELLWHFTAEFAPQGNIGKYDDRRIEAALAYGGKPGRLVAALVEAGWVDRDPIHRLLVHDWATHADDAVRKRLNRAGLPFLPDTTKVTGHRPPSADNGSLPEPEPEPEPEPAPTNVVELTSAETATVSPPPKYPKSLALVRTRWPDADEKLIHEIANRSNCEDDTLLELAIRYAHRAKADKQYSQGLFLTTVPPIVEKLRREGITATRTGAA